MWSFCMECWFLNKHIRCSGVTQAEPYLCTVLHNKDNNHHWETNERLQKYFYFIKYYEPESGASHRTSNQEKIVSFISHIRWQDITKEQTKKIPNKNEFASKEDAYVSVSVSGIIERMNKQMCASVNVNVMSIWTECEYMKLYVILRLHNGNFLTSLVLLL